MESTVLIHKSKLKLLSKLKMYNFDSRYGADEDGNVYLIKRRVGFSYKCVKMSPFTTKHGYLEYVLTQPDGTKKHIQGQRIIAGLYLYKPKGKDYVNHKNGIRSDNRAENLEWVTQSENIKHSFDVLNKVVWNKGMKFKK